MQTEMTRVLKTAENGAVTWCTQWSLGLWPVS